MFMRLLLFIPYLVQQTISCFSSTCLIILSLCFRHSPATVIFPASALLSFSSLVFCEMDGAVKGSRLNRTTFSFRLRSPSLNSVRLRRIFDLFDRNNDNLITVDELSEALNLLGLDTDFSQMESIVRSFIKPGYSGLRFEDFDALHRSLDDVIFGSPLDSDLSGGDAAERTSSSCLAQEENDLTLAFKVFDEDGDGFISAKELQAVLAKLGLLEEGREMERVEQMISSVDQNHDGRVDFFEFKDMMRSVIVRTS